MVERDSAKREFEPERGGGQEPGGLAVIVDVGDGGDGVGHLVVHDGVYADRHGVLRQDLKDGADGVGRRRGVRQSAASRSGTNHFWARVAREPRPNIGFRGSVDTSLTRKVFPSASRTGGLTVCKIRDEFLQRI